QELVTVYQNTVLNANKEVEDGLATFLRAHRRTALQQESVDYINKAVDAVEAQYKAGLIIYTALTLAQQNQVQRQDTLAQAQGETARGLTQVSRAVGGGWDSRGEGCEEHWHLPPLEAGPVENVCPPIATGPTLGPPLDRLPDFHPHQPEK